MFVNFAGLRPKDLFRSDQLLSRMVAKALRPANRAVSGELRFTTNCLLALPSMDLHPRTMHVCVVDAEGRTREHVNLPCDPGRGGS